MQKYTFFWHGPFSQWYPSPFKILGIEYNCAEQYMMSQKAILFQDHDTLHKIMSTSDPRKQKKLGKQVKGFDNERWTQNIFGTNYCKFIVLTGNLAKFGQNIELAKLLVNTEGELVEASPYDKIWGIGLGETNPDRFYKDKWRGTNWLGEILTNVKETIKKEFDTFNIDYRLS